MQFIRQIYSDLPDSIIMPVELRHRKVEVIILPLDDIAEPETNDYHIIEIDNISKFSREELHER
jgi:hypothetical protein